MKLYTPPGNFRAFKILIAAEFNDVDISIPDFKEFKPEMSPTGRLPILETGSGVLFESNAIARYIARIRSDTGLMGATFFDSAAVDSWIDFCSNELELPATLWFYPVVGYLPPNEATSSKAKADFTTALGKIEAHLDDKTYLVGHGITLADISVVCTLLYPMKFLCAPDYLKSFPNVVRWFTTCVNKPQMKRVLGEVVLAKEELSSASISTATTGVKKDKKGKKEKGGDKGEKKDKPKAEKKEKPKESAPAPAPVEEPPKKKEEHPLKIMDKESPSPFIMDAWKKTYSNCSTYDEGMAEFWKTFDSEGYSLWYCDYKYNDELTKLFMTCNLVGGYIQRTDAIRKWTFGSMWILGEDAPGKMHIKGLWLLRGQSEEHMLEANPDAELYSWTKLPTPVSDEEKKRVFDYWCAEDKVDELPVLDCKIFK